MTASGWILVVVGGLVNYLAKPLLTKKTSSEEKGDPDQKLLYTVKLIGLCLVIAGAVMIFLAGGKVDVGAIR